MKDFHPSAVLAIGIAVSGAGSAAAPTSAPRTQFLAHPTHCAVWLGGPGDANEQMSTTSAAAVAALGNTASHPEQFTSALKDLNQRCRAKQAANAAPAKGAVSPGAKL